MKLNHQQQIINHTKPFNQYIHFKVIMVLWTQRLQLIYQFPIMVLQPRKPPSSFNNYRPMVLWPQRLPLWFNNVHPFYYDHQYHHCNWTLYTLVLWPLRLPYFIIPILLMSFSQLNKTHKACLIYQFPIWGNT